MMSVREKWNGIAVVARSRWARHHQIVLCLSVAFMSVFSAYRLTRAFAELLSGLPFGDVPNFFHPLIHRWVASLPVYDELSFAVHPPATYLMLWPFFGWLEMEPARWLWAATLAAAIVWLVYLTVRESGADTALERAFVALLPLSMYAMALTIRVGQLGVLLVPLLVTGVRLLHHEQPGWRRDLLSAFLVLLALVKPTVSLPFLWIALFLPGGLRTTVLVVAGYLALTLFAASYQADGLPTLLHDWLARGSELAITAGDANLHIWLAAAGLEKWILPASLLVLAGLGGWIYRHRRADLWLLFAVTAIVARFWTYHRQYDDLLLLLPEIALFRLAKRAASDGGLDVAAAMLLALSVASTLTPLRLLRSPTDWHLLLTGCNVILWIVLLLFLVQQTAREKHFQDAPAESRG